MKPAISNAEKHFTKNKKQGAKTLNWQEKAKQVREEKIARLRALRLAKETSDQ